MTEKEALDDLSLWCAAAPPRVRTVHIEKEFDTRAHCWRVTLCDGKKRPGIGVGRTLLEAIYAALVPDTENS